MNRQRMGATGRDFVASPVVGAGTIVIHPVRTRLRSLALFADLTKAHGRNSFHDGGATRNSTTGQQGREGRGGRAVPPGWPGGSSCWHGSSSAGSRTCGRWPTRATCSDVRLPAAAHADTSYGRTRRENFSTSPRSTFAADSWTWRVAGRQARPELHSRQQAGDGDDNEGPLGRLAEPAADPEDLDLWCRFHEAVEGLPVPEREVVSLTFYHGSTIVKWPSCSRWTSELSAAGGAAPVPG